MATSNSSLRVYTMDQLLSIAASTNRACPDDLRSLRSLYARRRQSLPKHVVATQPQMPLLTEGRGSQPCVSPAGHFHSPQPSGDGGSSDSS